MMTERYFEVRYTYDQLDSGQDDAGRFASVRRCATAEEALAWVEIIRAAVAAQELAESQGMTLDDRDEATLELVYDLIPHDGTFVSASAYEVVVERRRIDAGND